MVKSKNLFFLCFLLTFLFFAAAQSVWAYPFEVDDVITLHNGPGTTNGGEFIIKENGTVVHNTFCLEKQETFSYGQELTIKGINDYATAGGGGAADGKDYISDETRYLYYHFFIGDLIDYNFNDDSSMAMTRDESANALQYAIWMLENEMTYNSANHYINIVNSAMGIDGWRAGIDSVKVLNLYKPDGSNAQDQLTAVPEPGALLSLGVVLLGLGGITRRRFKN